MAATERAAPSSELAPGARQWLIKTFGEVPAPSRHICEVLNPRTDFRDRELQIMEVIGDRVIDFIVCEKILHDFPDISPEDLNLATLMSVSNERLIRFARDIGFNLAAPEPWPLRAALADRTEMLAAALLLDGHSQLAGELFARLVNGGYVHDLISEPVGTYDQMIFDRPREPAKMHMIVNWLTDRGITQSHDGRLLRAIPPLFETARQHQVLQKLGRAAVEAAVSLLAYQECAGHVPEHFHDLVHHHLKKDAVALESNGQKLSVASPEFTLAIGYVAARLGLGKVLRFFQDDPDFHAQIRERMPSTMLRASTEPLVALSGALPQSLHEMAETHSAHIRELNALADAEIRLRPQNFRRQRR